MLCMVRVVQAQPGNDMRDHIDCTASIRQHELDPQIIQIRYTSNLKDLSTP